MPDVGSGRSTLPEQSTRHAERCGPVVGRLAKNRAGITDLRNQWRLALRLALLHRPGWGTCFERDPLFQSTKRILYEVFDNFITQLNAVLFLMLSGAILRLRDRSTRGRAWSRRCQPTRILSSPWKELLTYYNQTQDMSLRWRCGSLTVCATRRD